MNRVAKFIVFVGVLLIAGVIAELVRPMLRPAMATPPGPATAYTQLIPDRGSSPCSPPNTYVCNFQTGVIDLCAGDGTYTATTSPCASGSGGATGPTGATGGSGTFTGLSPAGTLEIVYPHGSSAGAVVGSSVIATGLFTGQWNAGMFHDNEKVLVLTSCLVNGPGGTLELALTGPTFPAYLTPAGADGSLALAVVVNLAVVATVGGGGTADDVNIGCTLANVVLR